MVLPLFIYVENHVCLSRGVQVTMIVAAVEDLV
jgi:hypothetical protein